ncbi:hypothetical protein BG841_10015 [Marinobacter sp. X15-166B]|nr:hypothetical protein BG841_10015 [Marinobacter sp. X15-166B]
MTAELNRVWQRQANVQFTTGTIDSPKIPGNLGAQIVGANTAAPEWKQVVAFGTGGDWNVFLVWEFELVASAGVDAVGGGTAAGDTLLEDSTCNLSLSHEAGHHLSGATLPHTAATIMAGCGSITERVRKAEADAANP